MSFSMQLTNSFFCIHTYVVFLHATVQRLFTSIANIFKFSFLQDYFYKGCYLNCLLLNWVLQVTPASFKQTEVGSQPDLFSWQQWESCAST